MSTTFFCCARFYLWVENLIYISTSHPSLTFYTFLCGLKIIFRMNLQNIFLITYLAVLGPDQAEVWVMVEQGPAPAQAVSAVKPPGDPPGLSCSTMFGFGVCASRNPSLPLFNHGQNKYITTSFTSSLH